MNNMNKTNLLNLEYPELEKFILDAGMKKFNAKQIYTWLHQKTARKFEDMTNISKKDRLFLYENAYIPYLDVLEHQVSKIDRTEKYLFQLNDKLTIETVLIKHKDRFTVCVSTQVGCPVRCAFCATGLGGFKRNLDLSEIINQVYTINSRLIKKGKAVTNIVYMGMGEPLLNLDNVLKSIDVLSNAEGLNISKRKIVISTSGIIPGIEKLMEKRLPVGLAISLHAPTNEKRDQLVPINKRYPLEDLFNILTEHQKMNKRRITFEYVLLKGINTSNNDADLLADLLRGIDHTLNLIPLNPVENVDLKRPTRDKIAHFYKYLKEGKGINVTLRKEKGTDIDGACGQLRERKK